MRGMLGRIFRRTKSHPLWSTLILVLVPAGVLTLFSFSEPNLKHVSKQQPDPPFVAGVQDNGNLIFHVKLWAEFRNYGLKSGHVSDVKISEEGLSLQPEVKLIYLDRSNIHWLRKKRILCEFLVTVPPTALVEADVSHIVPKFRVVYFGSSGNELYWQGVNIYVSRTPHKEDRRR